MRESTIELYPSKFFNFFFRLTNSIYDKYITPTGDLDYQLLYKEMEKINGFSAQKRRESFYWSVKDYHSQLRKSLTAKGRNEADSDT